MIRGRGVPVPHPLSGTPVEGSGTAAREAGCGRPYRPDRQWNDSDECYRNLPVIWTVNLAVPEGRNSQGTYTLKAREETDSVRIVRSLRDCLSKITDILHFLVGEVYRMR